jgi:hypothetical protein
MTPPDGLDPNERERSIPLAPCLQKPAAGSARRTQRIDKDKKLQAACHHPLDWYIGRIMKNLR